MRKQKEEEDSGRPAVHARVGILRRGEGKALAFGARAATSWNQHEEFGDSCRMSVLDAAMLLGQLLHLDMASLDRLAWA